MSDSIALARLLLARSRFQLIAWSAWIAMSLTIAYMAGQVFGRANTTPVLMLLTFPAMLWSLAIFEFGNVENAFAGQSGYSHWLMRLPLSNRTLAFVPLAMRFVWMAFFYIVLVAASRFLAGINLPFWTGLLVFLTGGVWTSAIVWRPCRGIWSRIAMIAVPGVLYYALFASVMSVHFDNLTDIRILRSHPVSVKTVVYLLTLVAFGGGLWSAFGSITLARNNHNGLIPESKTKLAGWWGRSNECLSPNASKVKLHASRRHALAWHDLRRVILLSERSLLVVIGVFALFGMAFLPWRVANGVFSFLLLTNIGTIAGNGLIEPTRICGSSLPSYIAASPLTCAEVGFMRGVSAIRLAFACAVVFAIAYGVCVMMPYNQRQLSSWIASNNATYGDDWAGYRWMALVTLICVLIVPTRTLGFVWPTLTGRSRLAMFALVSPILLLFAAIFVVTYWFLQQTNWELAQANAIYWAAWIPTILLALLAIKFIASLTAGVLSVGQDLIAVGTAVKITIIWIVLTFLFTAVFHALIPDARMQLIWTAMVTALILPLGRVLVLPYAVYLNRYR